MSITLFSLLTSAGFEWRSAFQAPIIAPVIAAGVSAACTGLRIFLFDIFFY
jgi:hypothetical protein